MSELTIYDEARAAGLTMQRAVAVCKAGFEKTMKEIMSEPHEDTSDEALATIISTRMRSYTRQATAHLTANF